MEGFLGSRIRARTLLGHVVPPGSLLGHAWHQKFYLWAPKGISSSVVTHAPSPPGRMRLTSRQSISPWCAARRVFRHRREQQAARRPSRSRALGRSARRQIGMAAQAAAEPCLRASTGMAAQVYLTYISDCVSPSAHTHNLWARSVCAWRCLRESRTVHTVASVRTNLRQINLHAHLAHLCLGRCCCCCWRSTAAGPPAP